jgi:V8-like Glu-specific endopeptidase
MKKLLLTLICATSGATSFADIEDADAIENNPLIGIQNGSDFSKLPNGSDIKNLANSTVGILMPSGQCTGVAIADNIILTANHCTINDNKKNPAYGQPYFNAGDSIKLYFSDASNSSSKVINISRAWNKSTDKRLDGDDLSIIEFSKGTFKSFIPNLQIISSASFSKENVVNVLANKIWNGNNKLYAFGWGSQKKFQVGSLNVYEKDLGFEIGLNGVIDKASSKLLIPTYNFLENGNYSIWGGNTVTHTMMKLKTNNPEVAALTNLLSHRIPVEHGDSGGPLFACDSNGNSCGLLGVTSYIDDKFEIATTLANPFYDLITSKYKL